MGHPSLVGNQGVDHPPAHSIGNVDSLAARLAYLHICSYNNGVTGIRFEWDEAKNLINQRKHGVSFE